MEHQFDSSRMNQDAIADRLREDIRTGKLLSTGPLSAPALAERYGVSRTRMREALLRLEEAGMVSFEKNRGVRIRSVTLNDLVEIFQIRLQLEVPSAYRAAKYISPQEMITLEEQFSVMRELGDDASRIELMRHDIAFHDLVLRAAGNERLATTVRRLRDAVVTRRALTSRPIPAIVAEHEPILDAIRMRDPEKARAAMYDHIVSTGGTLFRESAQWEALPSAVNWDWAEGVGHPVPEDQ